MYLFWITNCEQQVRESGTAILRTGQFPDGTTDVSFRVCTTERGPCGSDWAHLLGVSLFSLYRPAPPNLHLCTAWLVSGLASTLQWLRGRVANSSTENHRYSYRDSFASNMHFLIIQVVYVFLLYSLLRITAPNSIMQTAAVFSPTESSNVKRRVYQASGSWKDVFACVHTAEITRWGVLLAVRTLI